ncbi:MAG: S-methyl-5-thioribose-1-phosphate isomerase [Bacteriovoracaceae bacterium]|nr:S-methyl-5-thioribose-1-phosphate isomerase [Bacteriovoracaceae bacterium]
MKVQGHHYRTIWIKENDPSVVCVIDQRNLPHEFIVVDLKTSDELARSISEMWIRGAGLIGVAAGYGMYLGAIEASRTVDFEKYISGVAEKLKRTRPTAVNLAWAVDRQLELLEHNRDMNVDGKIKLLLEGAGELADGDVEFSRAIGEHGVKIIENISRKKKGETVNILTHCNAGWLAFIDYGTATAPIYEAHRRGIKVHVWVDETRPRNQGARLTAWELNEQGVAHTVISDNVGGHLMQHGLVDMCIVGSDRTTRCGDVANKIGTYLKALAANDNNVPFYVALPSSTFDMTIRDGVKEIPIEQRGAEEVKFIQGKSSGFIRKVLLTPENSPAANYGFDVTPAKYVTGLITERGVCQANEDSITDMFGDLL